MLGIIGPSGAGKTTLSKVLAGAIPAEAGTIRIDGAKYSDWEPDELARHIGYLPQEPSLFEGTIKQNISRFADRVEGMDIDALTVEAAKAAGAHELILKLPKGYDTPLGPLGSGLSSGQAQRIALARAFYGKPVLLVLDEPNAFLDSDGEAALIRALAGAMNRGAAVIMIAHRGSILAGAKRLLVLEAGRPKLLGPPKEVAARLAQSGDVKAGRMNLLAPIVEAYQPDLPADDPRRDIRIGAAIVVLFFVVLLGWAAFAPLDAAVPAQGVIAVSGNRQTVQHREGGVVTAINIREGQRVNAGDVLIEMSAPDLRAQERALTSDYLTNLAQRARLMAERAGQRTFAPPAEFAGLPAEDQPLAAQALALQRAQLQARQASVSAQQSVLGQRSLQLGRAAGRLRRPDQVAPGAAKAASG